MKLMTSALCALALAAPPPPRQLPPHTSVVLTHPEDDGAARVGTYVSSTWGFSTRSYWIEGPSGVVLIDTQFLPSAAAEFVDFAEAATGKKAVLAIVLHANPDKFNGTAVMRSRGIKVVTSAQVRALIPGIHTRRVAAFYDRYKPDYPQALSLPDAFGDTSTQLHAGGMTLTAHVMGAGVSDNHVVVQWQDHVFAGDLVANGAHSWLELGHTLAWLQRLDEMAAMEPQYVHPGRGSSGDGRLLEQQRAYLQAVMRTVAAERPAGDPDPKALRRVRAALEQRFVGYRFAVFLNLGLPAEWRRQAALAPAR